MVAGHLQEKKGLYYIVLSLKDEKDNRKTKWIPTGLPVKKGNKKLAEAMLLEERQKHKPVQRSVSSGMLFTEYMRYWLKMVKPDIELDTYSGYRCIIESKIIPYFQPKGLTLGTLKPTDIQEFYTYCRTELGVSNNTVIHYHANLCTALNYAFENDLIAVNPIAKVKRPKYIKYAGTFYSLDELEQLFEVVRGDMIEFAVLMAAFYGLRRSEIAGLRWQDIDFKNDTITIAHTVVQTSVDGKQAVIAKDRAKNESSRRTLPLVPQYRELLLRMKARKKECQSLCGNAYHPSDYIYVDDLGEPVKPNFITQHFALVIKKNGLRKIRFHDLRHSCASLLLKNGVAMKDIQAWLGHSTYNTTAEFYAHLDVASKNSTGATMASTMDISEALTAEKSRPAHKTRQETCKNLERTQERTGPK